MSPRSSVRLVCALCVALLLGTSGAAGAAPRTLSTGFLDQRAFGGPDRDLWISRARAVGASRVRLSASWVGIAPSAPTAAQAVDPGWSGYRFAALDLQVRSAVAGGTTPFINVTTAPAWAEGPARPASARAGVWKPDPAAYGAFMRAVAARYSGGFPDPLAPSRTLPRIAQFQIWNEPNLDAYLAPQAENGRPYAPVRFRELVNAASAGIRAVQPRATVITGGLAPFGDYRTAAPRRTPPVVFLRSMLCLNAKLRRSCSAVSRFDVLAHHPYAVRKPSSSALNRDDVTIPDLRKLTRVTKAARTARTLARTPKLWVTEVSYDSAPPDPDGVPTATLRRWVPELLWRLWDQGAETVVWFQVQDSAPTPSFGATYQSGMYLVSGRRKSYSQSFRFPVYVPRRTRTALTVWARSPVAGRMRIQVRRGGAWRTARTLTFRAGGARSVKVARGRVTAVRAVVGGERSATWSTR